MSPRRPAAAGRRNTPRQGGALLRRPQPPAPAARQPGVACSGRLGRGAGHGPGCSCPTHPALPCTPAGLAAAPATAVATWPLRGQPTLPPVVAVYVRSEDAVEHSRRKALILQHTDSSLLLAAVEVRRGRPPGRGGAGGRALHRATVEHGSRARSEVWREQMLCSEAAGRCLACQFTCPWSEWTHFAVPGVLFGHATPAG